MKHSATPANDQYRELISLKYSKPPIRSLTAEQVLTEATNAMRRIHVITGWPIPDDVSYVKILAEELVLKLRESFYMLNFDEVVTAFRKNGIGVKDWGKNMNLDLICQVLAAYCTEREQASYQEEKEKSNVNEQRIFTQEENMNFFREYIEAFYQRYLADKLRPDEKVPMYFSEVLESDKLKPAGMSPMYFFKQCKQREIKTLYVKL